MTEHSPAFEEAFRLYGDDDIPLNPERSRAIEKRMEALEKKIRPDEREMFKDLWEGLYAASEYPLGMTDEEIREFDKFNKEKP